MATLGTRAAPTMPVIGVLDSISVDFGLRNMPAFRQGLGEEGYAEGQNVAIESAGLKAGVIGCRSWRPIWCAAG